MELENFSYDDDPLEEFEREHQRWDGFSVAAVGG